MSSSYISVALRRIVEERANYQCEYCRITVGFSFFPHEIDHVIPEKHGGQTKADNLALACWRCNRHKGTDLGSFDPFTKEFSFLFNPRNQKWSDHFKVENRRIIGLTPQGRTTINLFQFNSDERLAERKRLFNTNKGN